MALFHNFGVNRRNRLCDIQEYASAQFLNFLELAKNCIFLDRKLISALNETVDGHYLQSYAGPVVEIKGNVSFSVKRLNWFDLILKRIIT